MDSFLWVNMTWTPVQWIYLWSHWVLHQLETGRPVLQKFWISWLWTKINPQYVSFMIQLDDAMSIVINTYLYTPTEYHKHLARLNLAGENKRRDWQECAREEIPADESLRASGTTVASKQENLAFFLEHFDGQRVANTHRRRPLFPQEDPRKLLQATQPWAAQAGEEAGIVGVLGWIFWQCRCPLGKGADGTCPVPLSGGKRGATSSRMFRSCGNPGRWKPISGSAVFGWYSL